MENKQFIIIIV